MFGIGMTELLVIFVIGLLVLGPKRLPELARSLGRGLAEFRRASMDIRREFMDVADEVRIRPPSLEDTAEGMPAQAGDVASGADAEASQTAVARSEAPAASPSPESGAEVGDEAQGGESEPKRPDAAGNAGSTHG
jgi:Tat protein translocase TatB subunit